MKPACFFLTVLALAATATNALATADGPDFWRVWNVKPGDTLNFRAGPGTGYAVLGALAHNASKIDVVICVPTTTREQWFSLSEEMQQKLANMPHWCLIGHEGAQRGWVNRRFLTEDGE